MNIEDIRNYCIRKKEVTEGFPFDEDTLVFKVCGKMFLLASLQENTIIVKCDPELVVPLRERYSAVLPGYHMNKKFWNLILLNENISRSLIFEWIDHSYDQVVLKLPKKDRERLHKQDRIN